MVATGRTIVQEIDFAENGTVAYYSGSETLDTTQGEVLTAAEFSKFLDTVDRIAAKAGIFVPLERAA